MYIATDIVALMYNIHCGMYIVQYPTQQSTSADSKPVVYYIAHPSSINVHCQNCVELGCIVTYWESTFLGFNIIQRGRVERLKLENLTFSRSLQLLTFLP